MTSTHRPMAAVDTIWLRMDTPENLMVIDTVMWCAQALDVDRLRAVLAERLVERYPVFRQRAVEPSALRSAIGLAMPYWEDDPDFDLDNHLVVARLPRPGGQPALEEYVEQCMRTPLDHSRPLWQAHVVHGFGSGSALVMRFHHAMADGVALIRVLLDLTDATPDGSTSHDPAGDRWFGPPSPSASPDPTAGTSSAAVAAGAIVHGAAQSVGAVTGIGRAGLNLLSALPHLATPSGSLDALSFAEHTASQLATVANKLVLATNPDTVLHTRPGVAKRAVWSRPRSLPRLRRIARTNQATVNDVLITALASALSQYLADHGGTVPHLTTLVPVNLRDATQPLPRELGNRFALVFLPLPTDDLGAGERLVQSKHLMDEIKASPEAAITFGLISAVGHTGPIVERMLVDFFSSKGIGVTTNVPGPTSPRYLAGNRITGLLGWVPSAGDQTLGVCIITYAGTVRIGFRLDAALPDPRSLVVAFDRAIDELDRVVAPLPATTPRTTRPRRPAGSKAQPSASTKAATKAAGGGGGGTTSSQAPARVRATRPSRAST